MAHGLRDVAEDSAYYVAVGIVILKACSHDVLSRAFFFLFFSLCVVTFESYESYAYILLPAYYYIRLTNVIHCVLYYYAYVHAA